MFTVHKCCWLLSLRTGTLCIGMFLLISSIIHFFFALSENSDPYYAGYNKIIMVLHGELCIIDGCLLFGAVKDSKYFLIPWLALSGSTLVLGTLIIISVSVVYPISLILFIILVPTGYFWFVVLSYYVSLDPTRNFDGSEIYKEPPVYDSSMKYPEVV